MPIPVVPIAKGNKELIRVSEDGFPYILTHPRPPKDAEVAVLPFRQYFTDNGSSSGDNDMRVDGSTTPQIFCIGAELESDLYIRSVSILISDASATLDKFGNLTALTNGVDFEWQAQEIGVITIADNLTTNFEFVRLAAGQPAFGTGAGAFKANNVSGASEGYIPYIDLQETFGMQWGVKLRAGSTDKLLFRINDNITGVDAFNAIAYGIKV